MIYKTDNLLLMVSVPPSAINSMAPPPDPDLLVNKTVPVREIIIIHLLLHGSFLFKYVYTANFREKFKQIGLALFSSIFGAQFINRRNHQ